MCPNLTTWSSSTKFTAGHFAFFDGSGIVPVALCVDLGRQQRGGVAHFPERVADLARA